MPIISISVQNYKSLKSVSIAPKSLNVIVGANGSGKSNFADCLDFVGEVYRHGLAVAISRKGGYDNIAFRRQQRSKQPIKVELIIELTEEDVLRSTQLSRFRFLDNLISNSHYPKLRMTHSFEFAAATRDIRAQFKILQELLTILEWHDGTWQPVVAMARNSKDITIEPPEPPELPEPQRIEGDSPAALFAASTASLQALYRNYSDLWLYAGSGRTRMFPLAPTELLAVAAGRFTMGLQPFLKTAQDIKVFQISPMKSREVGTPTPSPELERSGGNLPAVIDDLKKNKIEAWSSVMEVMRAILPDLKSIDVGYTSSKRLGLFFREEGYGRSWSVDEVSDGTLQTLALLVALFEPSSSLLVLEELENSVHPWIIRRVIEACRQASTDKQIILTTHSPIVLNAVGPEDLWIIWRHKGESQLAPIAKLDDTLLAMWTAGQISTFEYIDSGAIPFALPPEPSDEALHSEVAGAK